MYLSAVYTLADLVLDWKGVGARIADVTRKPVDVVNNDDPDPHAVADMVLARGNVLDACTTLGNRRMASSSPQSGGLCPVSAHRGTRRLRPRRADGARDTRGRTERHRPNGLGPSCGRGRRTSPPGPSHLCALLCPPRRRAKCSCRESRTIAWLPGAGKARPLRGASPLPVGVVLEPLRGPLSTALDKAQHRRARYIPATSSDLEGVVRDAYQWRAESARRIPSRRAVPSCVGPRSCPVDARAGRIHDLLAAELQHTAGGRPSTKWASVTRRCPSRCRSQPSPSASSCSSW